MNVAVVGYSGGTHLGDSFLRAAAKIGIAARLFDAAGGMRGPRLLRSLVWRAARRPVALHAFSDRVIAECLNSPPDILVALGTGALNGPALHKLRARGIICLAFASDDPWNRSVSGRWVLDVLPAYDAVFTPRRANIQDLRQIGCRDVRYLPFAFDEDLFGVAAENRTVAAPDILFVGGADHDRVAFMAEFMRSGLRPYFIGGYWDRFPQTRPFALGFRTPREINALTAATKVNLCLVRRANRDGHVMRSFEIAAAGGCMLAEDTEEHREIFGADGESVIYFRNPPEAAERALWLLDRPAERARLGAAVRARVGNEKNTYRARLVSMLGVASSLKSRHIGAASGVAAE